MHIASAVMCAFAGVAITFAGFYDLYKITTHGFDSTYMDYVIMVGFTSMGFATLALAVALVFNTTCAFYTAITFAGILVVAFTVGAFHTNLFFGISMVCGILFVVGFFLRTNGS